METPDVIRKVKSCCKCDPCNGTLIPLLQGTAFAVPLCSSFFILIYIINGFPGILPGRFFARKFLLNIVFKQAFLRLYRFTIKSNEKKTVQVGNVVSAADLKEGNCSSLWLYLKKRSRVPFTRYSASLYCLISFPSLGVKGKLYSSLLSKCNPNRREAQSAPLQYRLYLSAGIIYLIPDAKQTESKIK